MLESVSYFVLVVVSAALVLTFVRLVRGPSLADRVIALDLVSTQAVGIIGAATIITREPFLLRAAIVLALITFLGTVAFARYLEKRAAP
jgi:multicomponent Na+:H+ antiporter subunit F